MLVNNKSFGGSLEFYLTAGWSETEVVKLPARTLAYIGDAVYELGLRLLQVYGGIDDAGRLHDSLVKKVSSIAQSRVFEAIFQTLQPKEQEMLKTWRNAKIPGRYGSGTRAEYARATALEAFTGYLFLTNQQERLQKLFCDIVRVTS